MIDFKSRRFDSRFHLGMGDIRLTLGDQEEIEVENAALRARIAELEAAQEWRPIDEAPSGEYVILWLGLMDYPSAYVGIVPDDAATHYMPLPKGPEE